MKLKHQIRVPLAHLPTPIEALPRLTAAMAGPTLFVKRDDQTGLAFGGNKTRKLEFLLAEAQQHQARTLITAGGTQSNHCRQTAAAAAKLGMACILVLNGEENEALSGNLMLDDIMGAERVLTTRAERDDALRATFERAQQDGREPYLIPVGGSVPLGAVGYAHAFFEMREQGLDPDWIVVASSSGGTQAGLVAGASVSGYQGKILGISIDSPGQELTKLVGSLAAGTVELLTGQSHPSADDVHVNAGYLGGGYGVLSEAEAGAIRKFAELEGLFLDPVYTGRAGSALLDLIRQGHFKKDETVLFWHTGGTPALFANKYAHRFQ